MARSILIACFVMSIASAIVSRAHAQIGPSHARQMATKDKSPPMMLIEQKPRSVAVEITVAADGHVVATRVLEPSGNGVYDERVRGYWKERQFVPSLDAAGNPQAETLRTSNTFIVEEKSSGALKVFHSHSQIDGVNSADSAARINRMHCADFLWEYDFMKTRAPKADHSHDELFTVAFAMFVGAAGSNEAARDALIAQWPALIVKVIEDCRAHSASLYWKENFVPVFSDAVPYSSPPVR